MTQLAVALAAVSLAAACSTWDSMSQTQQGTAVGAGGGAVAGAVVAGPVGAVVGGVAGGTVGHETAKDEYGSNAHAANSTTAYRSAGNETSNSSDTSRTMAATSRPQPTNESSNRAMNSEQQGTNANGSPSASNSEDTIRSAQQALNDQGYNAGPVDGLMGPKTAAALRKFQSSSGLPSTGQLDSATVAALGIPTSNKSASG